MVKGEDHLAKKKHEARPQSDKQKEDGHAQRISIRREGAMEASELYDRYSEVKDLLAYLIEGRFLDSTHWIVLSVAMTMKLCFMH